MYINAYNAKVVRWTLIDNLIERICTQPLPYYGSSVFTIFVFYFLNCKVISKSGYWTCSIESVSMSTTETKEGRERHRPHNAADGFGIYKFLRARDKLEFDTKASTTAGAARIICHSVAEYTTLHGMKQLRRAKGERAMQLLEVITKF